MSDLEAFDLDEETKKAWSRLQARLAVQLATIEDHLVLAAGPAEGYEDERGPYVQFSWNPVGVRVEASSNEHLSSHHRLDARAQEALVDLGFEMPTTHDEHHEEDPGSPDFFVNSDPREADRLAAMAVSALRDVFGVPHPAFVRATGPTAGELPIGERAADDGPGIVVPRSRPHLQALIDETLIAVVGDVPARDEDGDVPVPANTAVAFVRALHHRPAVQLYAEVVKDITEPDRVAFEVGVLNRDSLLVKYTAVDDCIIATLTLPAVPYVAKQVLVTLDEFLDEIDRVDDDLAVRLGGRRFLDCFTDEECEDSGDGES